MKREVWYDGPPYGPDILTQEQKHDRRTGQRDELSVADALVRLGA